MRVPINLHKLRGDRATHINRYRIYSANRAVLWEVGDYIFNIRMGLFSRVWDKLEHIRVHYVDATWVSWRLRSPATRLQVQKLQTVNPPVIPHTKGHLCNKFLPHHVFIIWRYMTGVKGTMIGVEIELRSDIANYPIQLICIVSL